MKSTSNLFKVGLIVVQISYRGCDSGGREFSGCYLPQIKTDILADLCMSCLHTYYCSSKEKIRLADSAVA